MGASRIYLRQSASRRKSSFHRARRFLGSLVSRAVSRARTTRLSRTVYALAGRREAKYARAHS